MLLYEIVRVSIQLVSPASGDMILDGMTVMESEGFHSISFPSEWGHECYALFGEQELECFHSISFPSEWGLRLYRS